MKTVLRLWQVLLSMFIITALVQQLFAQEDEPPGRRVLIGFKPGLSIQAVEDRTEVIRRLGGTVRAVFELIPAVSAWMPEQAIGVLELQPGIAYVEDDAVLYAFGQSTPWGVDRIDAELVWPGGDTGAGVDVAIIDTGIDSNHPDLAVVDGINYTGPIEKDGSTDPAHWKDGHGHGTHCAGIVAALNNDFGVVGVAPGARLHAVKVLSDFGFGYTSDVIRGLDWCAAHHMRVASMSLGGGGSTSLKNACDAAFAAGVLLVAAAGNSSGPVSYPAAYPSVIAVSATDSQDKLAYFSNFGPEIELAAPGVNVYSTFKDGSYASLSGTSMACPHVTGVAALIWASGVTTNVAVSDRLIATAEDIGTPGRDPSFGYGLVDAQQAVTGPAKMHISAIEMWSIRSGRGYLVYTRVTIVDNAPPSPKRVSGATVSVTTARPIWEPLSQDAVTDSNGAATLLVRSAVGGTFTSTVTNVTGSLAYDPSANTKTEESCTVP